MYLDRLIESQLTPKELARKHFSCGDGVNPFKKGTPQHNEYENTKFNLELEEQSHEQVKKHKRTGYGHGNGSI